MFRFLAAASLLTSAVVAAPTKEPDRAAQRQRLKDALDNVVKRSALSSARAGISVVSLDTGDTVFSYNADELLNPASNVKLFTTAAALAKLGPEYKYATDFACAGGISKGSCGTLYIKGRGDPMLYTERIYGIVGELVHRGLRKVGDIVVDDTYFDTEREGPGWEQERTDKPYLSPTGALSVNHNAVAIYYGPGDAERGKGRIELEPMSDYFVVENKLLTVGKRGRRGIAVRSYAAGDKQRITVSGQMPIGIATASVYRKIDNPPMYAGETFKAILRQRGVEVKGKVRLGVEPADAQTVFTHLSPALAEIVRELNKVSNNFVAEQLLKSTGAEMKGPPGTWSKGVAAVEEYLADLGIPKGSYVMKNGSGLNDTNRFSASQLTRLLAAVQLRTSYFPEYVSSLGIAARDGTIRSRLEGTQAAGRLRGKTGTLENVTALSGYVRVTNGETYVYSILVNDFASSQSKAVASIDALAATIAGAGLANNDEPPARPPDSSPVELRARVATYANLGKVADRRNLPFLRSALRTETDPVIRAVLADAIYRSDTEGGQHFLLENVPLERESLAKLRALGDEMSLPVPLVSSLADLAADGNSEALDRLIGVTQLVNDDEGYRVLLADAFEGIARTAPEALVEGIRRAPDAAAEVSTRLLARGIAESEDHDAHPLLSRLKEPFEHVGAPAAEALRAKIEKYVGESKKAAEPPAGDKGAASAPATEQSSQAVGGG